MPESQFFEWRPSPRKTICGDCEKIIKVDDLVLFIEGEFSKLCKDCAREVVEQVLIERQPAVVLY